MGVTPGHGPDIVLSRAAPVRVQDGTPTSPCDESTLGGAARDHADDETLAPAASSEPAADVRVGILLAIGQELLARALSVALNQEPSIRVVDVQSHPSHNVGQLLGNRPHVVLVDTPTAAARLRDDNHTFRVVVLGSPSDPDVVLECIRAGAAACVGKDAQLSILTDSIKRVNEGEILYPPDVVVKLLLASPVMTSGGSRRTAKLGERELDVLNALAMGLTAAEAADYLGITLNTVRTHVKNILNKLAARSKLEAVLIAIREGRIGLPPETI